MLRNTLWVLGLGALLASHAPATEDTTCWTMLNVTPREDVADSHLIEFPGGATALIDAGRLGDSPGAVLTQLRAKQVTSIDLVIISHFHVDHYGALTELIDNGIKVKLVAVNIPDQAAADLEKPWGCNLDDVNNILKYLDAHDIPYFTPEIGDRLMNFTTPQGTEATLDVICLYNGVNSPVGRTDVNDSSMIIRLSHGPTKVLFTGDLNHRLGAFLAASDFDLKADILKAPHHGTEGLPPNEFFDRVGAKAVLVPSPKRLWQSARSKRLRNYYFERKVPVYVSGLQGNVMVTMDAKGYVIKSGL